MDDMLATLAAAALGGYPNLPTLAFLAARADLLILRYVLEFALGSGSSFTMRSVMLEAMVSPLVTLLESSADVSNHARQEGWPQRHGVRSPLGGNSLPHR